MSDYIGYVYLTTNLVNGKQYVGQHLSDGFDKYYKGSGTYILRALNKYGFENFSCVVLQWCKTQTQLNEVEYNCIKLYGTMHPKGYNLKNGGAHGKYSKEARKKISDAIKGKQTGCKNHFYGKKHTEEARKKMSEAKKGHIPWNKGKKGCYSEEQLNKNRNTNIKFLKDHPERRQEQSELMKNYYKTHRPPNTKPVYQYTLNGEFVKKWESLKEASDYYGGGHITSVCQGKRKSTKGYKWSFEPLN